MIDVERIIKGLVYAIHDEYAVEHEGKEQLLREFLDWLEQDGCGLTEQILNGCFPEHPMIIRTTKRPDNHKNGKTRFIIDILIFIETAWHAF